MSKIKLDFEEPQLLEVGHRISHFSGSFTFVDLSSFDNRFPDLEATLFELPLQRAPKRTKKEKEYLEQSFLFKTK